MSVMADWDPDKEAISKSGRMPASNSAISKRVTGINPSTGQLQVEGGSDVPLYFYISSVGNSVIIAPMRDDGIDQDPRAHAARRPRSLADVGGIDQLEG